ncbi:MAG: hypothetical protein AAB510_02000 [Patescibacteria group bacterium]
MTFLQFVLLLFVEVILVYVVFDGLKTGVLLHRLGGKSIRAKQPISFWMSIVVTSCVILLIAFVLMTGLF